MKNILLLVHDDAGQEARLQVALDVVRAVKGHLTCLDIAVPVMLAGDFYTGGGEAVLLGEEQSRESANRERTEARLKKESVSWDWHDATGYPAPVIRQFADFADLIVLSAQLGEGAAQDARRMVGQVVTSVKRPLLAVPRAARGLTLSGPVLIAWDGSHEANQAIRAAVPLLKLAERVTLLGVNRRDEGFGAEDAATYLSRHSIHVEVETEHAESSIAGAIIKRAAQMAASYIVMGAYGDPPAVEALFGGVTRTILAESPVPLLMAH